MPRCGATCDENGAAPLGQGGAGSSRRLLSGWFDAAEGSEPQPWCAVSNHPRWAFWPSIPSSTEVGSLFSRESMGLA